MTVSGWDASGRGRVVIGRKPSMRSCRRQGPAVSAESKRSVNDRRLSSKLLLSRLLTRNDAGVVLGKVYDVGPNHGRLKTMPCAAALPAKARTARATSAAHAVRTHRRSKVC